MDHVGAELDPEVLQAVADTDSTAAIWACSLLLEREALTDAQLLAEWNAVSDAVLVEQDTASARFYAVQDRLRRQAPRELARTLADRLLALPPGRLKPVLSPPCHPFEQLADRARREEDGESARSRPSDHPRVIVPGGGVRHILATGTPATRSAASARAQLRPGSAPHARPRDRRRR